MRKLFLLVIIIIALSVVMSACSPQTKTENIVAMADMTGMPEAVKSAPKNVQTAYQFAVANPDVLGEIPCYCGCGAMGHTSNYACYVKDVSDGEIIFDDHALGCSICVDIALDTMRMMNEGRSTADIRASIDATYSQYGPSNIP